MGTRATRSYLTNSELISHLSLRDDLTDLELDLLDRLIRALDEVNRMDVEPVSCGQLLGAVVE